MRKNHKGGDFRKISDMFRHIPTLPFDAPQIALSNDTTFVRIELLLKEILGRQLIDRKVELSEHFGY